MSTLMHNQRVIHVLWKLFDLVSSETAIQWMITTNVTLGVMPISMIDDDAEYQRLIAAIESLKSGEPC